MMRPPFRWFSAYGFRNISYMWSDLTQGIANVIRWVPVIWYDRDYDSAHLLRIMNFKLSRSARLFREHGHHTSSEKDARQMAVCAELARRLAEDDWYYQNAERRYPEHGAYWVRHIHAKYKADREYMGFLLGKYIMGWWD